MKKEETKQMVTYERIFELEDFSTNGTYHRGRKMTKGEKVRLQNGDEIGIIPEIQGETQHSTYLLSYKFNDSNL